MYQRQKSHRAQIPVKVCLTQKHNDSPHPQVLFNQTVARVRVPEMWPFLIIMREMEGATEKVWDSP